MRKSSKTFDMTEATNPRPEVAGGGQSKPEARGRKVQGQRRKLEEVAAESRTESGTRVLVIGLDRTRRCFGTDG